VGGWFHNAWISKSEEWLRVKITATECRRITPAFLAREKKRMAPWRYATEYLCQFGTDESRSVFPYALVRAAISKAVKPLFPDRVEANA
jgi:hypothetical protein